MIGVAAGGSSRSATRRAIAGAGSIQSTGQGARPDQPVHQQRIMGAGQHHGVGARRSVVAVADKTGREFGQDLRDR